MKNRVCSTDTLIDAAGDSMCVHTEQNIPILRKIMKQLEAFLDPRQFIRRHRATLVNRTYIDKCCSNANGESYLVLKNTKQHQTTPNNSTLAAVIKTR
jgi:two-component system LytT family response regulator